MNANEFKEIIDSIPGELGKFVKGCIYSPYVEPKDYDIMNDLLEVKTKAENAGMISLASGLDAIMLQLETDLLPAFVLATEKVTNELIVIGDLLIKVKKEDMFGFVMDRASHLSGMIEGEIIEKKEYVYLMKNKRNGFIKIGYSTEPYHRERTLQSEEPEIDMILFFEGNRLDEKRLHETYKVKRQRGEWFRLTEKDVIDISKIFKHRNITKSESMF